MASQFLFNTCVLFPAIQICKINTICNLLLIAELRLHTGYVVWDFLSDILFIFKTLVTAETVLFVSVYGVLKIAITTFANRLP